MARQSNIKLSCTVGNVIFYRTRTGYYMRSKPQTVNQSKATKAAGERFGWSHITAKALRLAFAPIISDTKNKKMISRLAMACYDCINSGVLQQDIPVNNLPFITGFEYNPEALLKEKLCLPITLQRSADNGLVLHWPVFEPVKTMAAPAGTKQVVCYIMFAVCTFDEPHITALYTITLTIPYQPGTIPAQAIVPPIHTEPGCLTVCTMALQYFTGEPGAHTVVSNMHWLPCGVVGCMYN